MASKIAPCANKAELITSGIARDLKTSAGPMPRDLILYRTGEGASARDIATARKTVSNGRKVPDDVRQWLTANPDRQ